MCCVAEGGLEFVELLGLKEGGLSKRRGSEPSLVFPGWAVGVEERVGSGCAGYAARGQGVAVKGTVVLAGFGGNGADHAGIARDENRGEERNIEVAVVPSISVLDVG